ncbi:MAG: hypothetical protein KGJ13_08285 [Patescibacteria group bacterium]|nr:hypothetical protein [Patescibacteria group bacterium]
MKITGLSLLLGSIFGLSHGCAHAATMQLNSNVTCYVNTVSGSPNNDGSAGSPKRHFSDCINLIQNSWDIVSFTVTVQGVAGQVDNSPILITTFRGTGTVVVDCGGSGGGISSPGSLSPFAQGPIATAGGALGANFVVENCTLSNPGSWGFDLINGNTGMMEIGHGVVFGPAPSAQIAADSPGAMVLITDNYTIAGGAQYHYLTQTGGLIQDTGGANGQRITVTLVGNPRFQYFADASLGGNMILPFMTFQGQASGYRYISMGPSSIWTGTGTSYYFPGSAGGTLIGGGYYY